MRCHLHVGSKKENDAKAFYRNRLTDSEKEVTVTKLGDARKGDSQGVWDQQVHTAIFKNG